MLQRQRCPLPYMGRETGHLQKYGGVFLVVLRLIWTTDLWSACVSEDQCWHLWVDKQYIVETRHGINFLCLPSLHLWPSGRRMERTLWEVMEEQEAPAVFRGMQVIASGKHCVKHLGMFCYSDHTNLPSPLKCICKLHNLQYLHGVVKKQVESNHWLSDSIILRWSHTGRRLWQAYSGLWQRCCKLFPHPVEPMTSKKSHAFL